MKTKIESVKQHLLKHKSIDTWKAIQLYRATRLSGIIYVLKGRGMTIRSRYITQSNSNYVRYELITTV